MPPPAEETALSDPLADEAGASEEDLNRGGAPGEPGAVADDGSVTMGPQPELSGAEGNSPGAASGDAGGDTSVLVVDEASGNELLLVENPGETVATGEEAGAVGVSEFDPDPGVLTGSSTELTERDPSDTVATANDEAALPKGSSGESAGGNGEGLSPLPDAAGDGGEAQRGAADPVPDPSGQAPTEQEVQRYEEGTFTTEDGFPMRYEVGRAHPTDDLPSTVNPGKEDAPGMPQAVVFIHSWGGNRSQWKTEMRKLYGQTTVVNFDLLGHGDSKTDALDEREEWTIPSFGRDVAGLIEQLDLRDVVLVGHAMGGQVALEVALRVPERIAGVIGVESLQDMKATPDVAGDPNSNEQIASFQKNFRAAYSDFIEKAVHADNLAGVKDEILEDGLQCSPAVVVRLMKHFQTRDLKNAARSIECPVYCINSELFDTDIDGNQALLPDFGAFIMKGVGFWPHLEQPAAFHTELVPQLQSMRKPVLERPDPTFVGLMPVLFHDDIRALEAFYVGALRFDVESRVPNDEAAAATRVSLERDGVRLLLQSTATAESLLPNLGPVQVGGQRFFLRVTDIAAESQRLGPEVERVAELQTNPSGVARMAVKDPAGNVIILQQLRRSGTELVPSTGPGQE